MRLGNIKIWVRSAGPQETDSVIIYNTDDCALVGFFTQENEDSLMFDRLFSHFNESNPIGMFGTYKTYSDTGTLDYVCKELDFEFVKEVKYKHYHAENQEDFNTIVNAYASKDGISESLNSEFNVLLINGKQFQVGRRFSSMNYPPFNENKSFGTFWITGPAAAKEIFDDVFEYLTLEVGKLYSMPKHKNPMFFKQEEAEVDTAVEETSLSDSTIGGLNPHLYTTQIPSIPTIAIKSEEVKKEPNFFVKLFNWLT